MLTWVVRSLLMEISNTEVHHVELEVPLSHSKKRSVCEPCLTSQCLQKGRDSQSTLTHYLLLLTAKILAQSNLCEPSPVFWKSLIHDDIKTADSLQLQE